MYENAIGFKISIFAMIMIYLKSCLYLIYISQSVNKVALVIFTKFIVPQHILIFYSTKYLSYLSFLSKQFVCKEIILCLR